jgi:hypothetical protein
MKKPRFAGEYVRDFFRYTLVTTCCNVFFVSVRSGFPGIRTGHTGRVRPAR